jgi:dephospho-CoA kinase
VILRVGLTGGIASGKSTVARTFAGLGCLVIDADAVVARLYRQGEVGHEALVNHYGPGILRSDGSIDRARLADIAFRNAASAAELNALIHPLVLAEETRVIGNEEERFRGRDRIVVIEATLLLESGGKQRPDKIVVVDAGPEQQISRAVGRGMSSGDATRRMENQMSREERLAAADYVIDNSGDPIEGEAQTRRVFASLQQDLAKKVAGSR